MLDIIKFLTYNFWILRKSYLFDFIGLLLGHILLISWSILIIASFTKSAADPWTLVFTACLSAAARLKYDSKISKITNTSPVTVLNERIV